MTLLENLSNNARSENKNLFAEKIKKISFNFPARRGWTRSQSWPEVHGEGGAGRQEGEQTEKREIPRIANATSLFSMKTLLIL